MCVGDSCVEGVTYLLVLPERFEHLGHFAAHGNDLIPPFFKFNRIIFIGPVRGEIDKSFTREV